MNLVVIKDTDTREQLEQHMARLCAALRITDDVERVGKLHRMIDECLVMWQGKA